MKIIPEELFQLFSNEVHRKVVIDGTIINLSLWDSPGSREYDKIRPKMYSTTKLFILLFSIVKPTTLQQIREIYYPEIHKTHPNVPVILLGVQKELRCNEEVIKKLKTNNLAPIMKKDAKKIAKELKAIKYLELSSDSDEETKEIMNLAIRIAYYGRLRKRDQIRKTFTS